MSAAKWCATRRVLTLEGLDAARKRAVEYARDVMASEVREGRLCLSCHFEVAGESGEILASMPFKEAITISGL